MSANARTAAESAPANVIFTGFLEGHDYDRALEQADAIMVLTRHPLAVNRGAYEAVYFERPLIISDLPAMTPTVSLCHFRGQRQCGHRAGN